jgi:thiol-disulfide isomerase/thioredoxin
LIFLLSTTCPYCAASAPFYEKLTTEKGRRSEDRVRLIAYFVEEKALAEKYASEKLHASFDTIVQGLPIAGVAGTPTLLLVNARGEVERAWVGLLDKAEEEEVVREVLAANRAG